jgi:hypothetical protein
MTSAGTTFRQIAITAGSTRSVMACRVAEIQPAQIVTATAAPRSPSHGFVSPVSVTPNPLSPRPPDR